MERNSAVDIAAQCWCDPRVSDRVMDVEMCKVFAEALDSYANERLEEAAQIFESLPPDGGRVKVEVVIESIRSLKSKETV